MNIENLNIKIRELYDLYKNDEIILNKINHYINYELPNILIHNKKLLKDRENRKILLTEAHNDFVKKFITQNMYFFCSTSEIFFKYDNINYSIIREDDIIHNILSMISQQNNIVHEKNNLEALLIPWKYKIKTSIIKQIKDHSPFISIPESTTIQNTINLFYPSIFYSKMETKYFFTILGDNILKKHNNNIYLISQNIRHFLRILENSGGKYFGHIPLQSAFRYKYHDHNYNDCRLLEIKTISQENEINIIYNIPNLFIICCYYSNRYVSADNFLENCQNSDFYNHTLFLKQNSASQIIDLFIKSKIQTSQNSIISMKNMLYLWKCFLNEKNIPNIIFSANLKKLLREKLEFNENEETFTGYTSPSIPFVFNFLKFWEQNIIEDPNEYYLEIDELIILFKQSSTFKNNCDINEENIINLINHFYPDIIIDNNKYILSIGTNIWNKKEEITDFLNIYKLNCKQSITIYDIYFEYTEYSKKISKKNKTPIINKKYFELFIKEYLKEFINEDSSISDNWINIDK